MSCTDTPPDLPEPDEVPEPVAPADVPEPAVEAAPEREEASHAPTVVRARLGFRLGATGYIHTPDG